MPRTARRDWILDRPEGRPYPYTHYDRLIPPGPDSEVPSGPGRLPGRRLPGSVDGLADRRHPEGDDARVLAVDPPRRPAGGGRPEARRGGGPRHLRRPVARTGHDGADRDRGP